MRTVLIIAALAFVGWMFRDDIAAAYRGARAKLHEMSAPRQTKPPAKPRRSVAPRPPVAPVAAEPASRPPKVASAWDSATDAEESCTGNTCCRCRCIERGSRHRLSRRDGRSRRHWH